jgi:hypothetical protein
MEKKKKKKQRNKGLLVSVGIFFATHSFCRLLPWTDSRVKKCRRCFSCALVITMGSSSGTVPVLWCSVLFNGTNYRYWVPRMHLHMSGLRLWDFPSSELPCPPSPLAPAQPVISEKTTAAEKERLIVDYDDRLVSYESQFRAYKTLLDEDAQAGLVLTASMEDYCAADIVNFECTH